MKYIGTIILVVGAVLAGCGTINTVLRDDDVVKNKLKKVGTYCKSIPRIYSGVIYDFCYLNGRPYNSNFLPTHKPLPGAIVDMGLCGILDTAALPYTIYMQSTEGSIELN